MPHALIPFLEHYAYECMHAHEHTHIHNLSNAQIDARSLWRSVAETPHLSSDLMGSKLTRALLKARFVVILRLLKRSRTGRLCRWNLY